MKLSTLRLLTATIVLFLILVGSFGRLGFGTLCSLDLGGVRLSCPLGFLQTSLASRTITREALASVGLVVLATLFLGRVFCSWICPTTLLRWLFKKRAPNMIQTRNQSEVGQLPISPKNRGLPPQSQDRYGKTISLSVLGGSLLSSFVFGFPVFCAICPIGLTFGTLLAVKRLLFGQQPSLELLLFPLIIIVEIFVMRSWCIRLCPLGALLSLIGGTRLKILKPTIDPEKCLVERGINCQACKKACSQAVVLRERTDLSLSGCTNCLDCWKKCPTHAIKPVNLPAWSHLRNKAG
jgi:ferredoxin-type protein NapH